jgi:hypothetical protein
MTYLTPTFPPMTFIYLFEYDSWLFIQIAFFMFSILNCKYFYELHLAKKDTRYYINTIKKEGGVKFWKLDVLGTN